MGRQSSVRGDFLHAKTAMGLKQFEVGKSRSSYDVPFRSYIFEFGMLRSWPKRVTNRKMLRYDWRPTHRLQLHRRDFGESKLVWVYSYIYRGGRRRGQQKSCFKSAENWAASSLWVGGHQYTGIKLTSNLVWLYSGLKLGHHFGQFLNPLGFT